MPFLRDEYLKSLAIKGFSQNTSRIREIYIRMFMHWCGQNGITSATNVTHQTLENYQRYLFFYRKRDGRPLAFSTQHSRLAVISLWFKWMERRNFVSHDPTVELELPRVVYKLPTVMTRGQIELVLNQPNLVKPTGVRDRAILEMLYSTGMRRTELLSLELYDIDRDRGVLTIREGKGKRDRVVPFGERASRWLDEYLGKVRPALAVEPDCEVVFLTSTGKPITPNHLSWLVRRYILAANLGKNGACHIFRHTMATLMLEGGADTRYIQAMLGHARLDTTQIYTHVSIRKLKQIHRRTHPSARI